MTLYDVAAGTTGRAWMICRQSFLGDDLELAVAVQEPAVRSACRPHPRVRLGPQVGVRELPLFGGRPLRRVERLDRVVELPEPVGDTAADADLVRVDVSAEPLVVERVAPQQRGSHEYGADVVLQQRGLSLCEY